ncbi:unnamed protein product [Paramecium sonneborni]|uniref:Transmembrane protein n=1 Tax=Paramecium sonneborni TaxID=65129 RepID=A0A8S1KPQ0_9CILI|nr:unnamed protein product [Paramecium sonneborni]
MKIFFQIVLFQNIQIDFLLILMHFFYLILQFWIVKNQNKYPQKNFQSNN